MSEMEVLPRTEANQQKMPCLARRCCQLHKTAAETCLDLGGCSTDICGGVPRSPSNANAVLLLSALHQQSLKHKLQLLWLFLQHLEPA